MTATTATSSRRQGGLARRGFTLIEVMLVMVIVGIASSVAVLALQDPSASQLEREAARLSALLEVARTESRVSGVQVLWVPAETGGFTFVGLQPGLLPTGWNTQEVRARIETDRGTAKALVLGPEPIIGAQRVILSLNDRSYTIATDGLGPFEVPREEDAAAR